MKKFIYILMMVMFGMSIMTSCNEIENEDDNGTPTLRQVKKYIAVNYYDSKEKPEYYWVANNVTYIISNKIIRTNDYFWKIYFTKDGYYGYSGLNNPKGFKYKIVEENGEIHIILNDFKYEYINILKCTKDELEYEWCYPQEIYDEVERRKGQGEEFEWVYFDFIKQFVRVYAIDLVDFVGGKPGEQSFWVYYYINKDDNKTYVLWNWEKYIGWYDRKIYRCNKKTF